MQKLILIRGLPGSGKTTFAKSKFKGFILCEADQYFYRLGGGKYKFEAKRLGQAHAWCLRKVKRNLVAGFNCVVANTFTQLRELQAYLDLAKQHEVEAKVFKCTGDYGSIHNVPEIVVQKMKARFECFPSEFLVSAGAKET